MKSTTTICKWSLIWNVITLSRPLTKIQKAAVKRVCFSASITDNAILMHGGVDQLTERVQKVMAIVGDRKEKSIRFTDKQYGLSMNSYNGIALSNCITRHSIIIKSGNVVTTIPVTELQIKKAL